MACIRPQLRDWKKQVLDGLPNLFEQSPEAVRQAAAEDREREKLFAQIGPANDTVGLAQKKSGLEPPRNERVAMVDWTDRELPVSTQADLLSLNRSSLYYQPLPPSPDELWFKRRIDEIYTGVPFYGSRKITVELNKERLINRKAVQRHMREMGLSAICPGPNLSHADSSLRFSRIYCGICPPRARITSGASTSLTFGCRAGGCI